MNNAAIDKGVDALVKIDVPASWKDAVDNGEKMQLNLVASLAQAM